MLKVQNLGPDVLNAQVKHNGGYVLWFQGSKAKRTKFQGTRTTP